jgi:hypothetical protein
MNEGKKGYKEIKHAATPKQPAPKPRNFVAKNAAATTSGAGAHKDKKKAAKQGETKHKKTADAMAENIEYAAKLGLLLKVAVLKDRISEAKVKEVAGPEKCWPGHRKVGTKPGTGKNAGKRVNDCEKIGEGKEDKIAQLKKDHETAVHWSKNEKSPQKREAARQKAEKIKRHLETQYKQGVAENYRSRRDAYQRDYDHSVAGMGRRQSQAYQDDGGANDERHDLDPTEWYIVKDGKMFKATIYPNQERAAMAQGYSRTRDEAKAKASQQDVAEGEGNVEIGQQMADDGITYSPDKEDELIGLMSQYMKKAGMSSRQIRYLLSYDEDYIPDQLSFLPKKGMAEGDNPEYDDEAGMADNNLETLARAVEGLDNLISAGDNLPEWCQEKIAVAKSMLVTVWDYMESEKGA